MESFFTGFCDEMVKLGGPVDTVKGLIEILRRNPKEGVEIAKEIASGPGSGTAKGLLYGSAGMGALKGLGRRDPETHKREPLKGAVGGAIKGGLVGIPIALALRYPALRRAVQARQ